MTSASSPLLRRAIDAMAVPGILVAHRLIAAGDEQALLPEEFEAFARSVVKVQRASGAARIVARELLQQLGALQRSIPKSASGAPVFPKGIVGSLAHASEVAVAAAARFQDFASVGVDIEPAEPLDADLLNIVATAGEREAVGTDGRRGRLLFCIKEAVYKAVYPLDRIFLDHHDVEVNLAAGSALVRNGRAISFRYCVATHMVALAYIPTTSKAS